MRWAQGITVAFLAAGTVYLWLFPPLRVTRDYGIDTDRLVWFALALLAVGSAGLWAVVKESYRVFLAPFVAMTAVELFYFLLVVAPAVHVHRSTDVLTAKMDRLLAPGEQIAQHQRIRDSALFYSDRTILMLRRWHEVEEYFYTLEHAFVWVDDRELFGLEDLRRAGLVHVVGREGPVYILSNRDESLEQWGIPAALTSPPKPSRPHDSGG